MDPRGAHGLWCIVPIIHRFSGDQPRGSREKAYWSSARLPSAGRTGLGAKNVGPAASVDRMALVS